MSKWDSEKEQLKQWILIDNGGIVRNWKRHSLLNC